MLPSNKESVKTPENHIVIDIDIPDKNEDKRSELIFNNTHKARKLGKIVEKQISDDGLRFRIEYTDDLIDIPSQKKHSL